MKVQSINRYEAYKDSGVSWLGKFPEHWVVCKLKDIAFYQEGPGIMADDFMENGVPLIRISGMKGTTVSLDGCNFLDPVTVDKKWKHFKLKLGELLVSASATTGIAAKVNEATVGAIPYTGLIKFKPRNKLYLDYLHYFLTVNIFTNQIDLQKSGSTIQHYGPTHLGRILSVLPPLAEQASISSYLDTKTAQIDRQIDLLSQKAAQYGKLKQSLINETVTRGLDKTVEMKDSVVEWIGEVPAHWEVTAVTNITDTASIKNHPNEELLSVYRDYGVIIKSTRDDNHNKAGADLSSYKLVEPGYLVINKMKAWQGSLGVSEYRGIVSPAYITCKTNKRIVERSYLHHLLRCRNYINEYNRLSYGVRVDQWDMRYDDFKYVPVLLPPLLEQQAIANYLDEKTAHIDRIVATINSQIDKLKELRKTLINDIVTGKICVSKQEPHHE